MDLKINKEMYGPKRAAILAYNKIKASFAPFGYFSIKNTVGIMWNHHTHPTNFCLRVDNFGVQYHSDDNTRYLIMALQQQYHITFY